MSDSSKSRQAGAPRWALVTGAARRIGAAIARRLHARGCEVMLHHHRSAAEAQSLAEELERERPQSTFVVQADLVTDRGVRELAAAVMDRAPRLALLVNNASRFYPTPAGKASPAHWDELLGSNLRGPFFLCQALSAALAGGAIVNITDIHARRPLPDHSVYCMAKAGLEMMTFALARDLGPAVRVNGVAPGAILWPEQGLSDAARASLLERVVMGRLGRPEDIAEAVAFLGLDAEYVTGQVLAVDGGRSLNV